MRKQIQQLNTMRKIISNTIVHIAVAGLLVSATAVSADWELDETASSLQYLSSKMVRDSFATIFESNQFTKISGQIQNNQLVLTINTASVNTKIPIRDIRITEHVFQSKRYPLAQVTLRVDEKSLNEMVIGVVEVREVQVMLTLRDITHPVSGKVSIVRTQDNHLLVQTIEPVLVDADRYAMGEGFSILQEIAKLFKIPTVIPVSFSLLFVHH